jgi:diguanylate cyclase (GGDEF)-like protein
MFRDVTERKRAEEALAYQATHDTLTGLGNRLLLLDRLREAMQLKTPVALLLMDLDRFKEVNDTLGHHAGDALLQQIGARLRGVLRDALAIARLGGDEFAAIVPTGDAERIANLGKDVLHMFETPCQIEGQPVVIGASIGVALSPRHGDEAQTLLRRADVAMYVAKRDGDGLAFYDSSHEQLKPDRLVMIGDLRRAVEQGELVLHFQPKIHLRTRRLVGVEALVRWHHPLRGLVAPDQFIPVAEQAGLIDSLSQWVLRAAMRQSRAWRRSGLDIPIAINLSPRNLHDQRLPDMVAELLEEHDLPASALGVEITESTLMADLNRGLHVLNRLREMGLDVAIDDFGTGHSSLAYLKRLPVSELKIDRSFVSDLLRDKSDQVIVRAAIELAHSLGLTVTAEGIQDELTQQLLMDMGCDVGQGFQLARPLRGPEVSHWVHEQASHQRAA